MLDHRVIDERSLRFGQLIAQRLPGHPEHLRNAQSNLERWMRVCAPNTRPTLEEWKSILDGPLEKVIAVLTGTDERATRLRQSNPFTGVLTPQERNQIILEFHDKAAT